jgi:tetratricopeptide (TPR) repeat protein
MTAPMEPVIDGWQRDVQSLWEQGQRQGAIDLLLSRLNALAPPLPRVMGIQFSCYLFLLGDLATAESFLRRLVAAHPSDPQVLENLAVVLSRQEKNAEALPLWEAVTSRRPQSINAWDGLANCRADLGQFEGARQAGEVALQPEEQSLRQKPCWRFQVANDPEVGRFAVRDCDSVVSLRERHAVEEWLAGDRWFHVMRWRRAGQGRRSLRWRARRTVWISHEVSIVVGFWTLHGYPPVPVTCLARISPWTPGSAA